MYKYEMHLHTKQVSRCAKFDAKKYVDYYQSNGYDGIFVTDHFYHGNCAVDKYQDWDTWVEQFCEGYNTAKEYGDAKGFKVFFGFEENFDYDEYLVYGVTPEWLKKHEEARTWTRSQMAKLVHDEGGIVIQAHPFRDVWYISDIKLNLDDVDGIEVINTANKQANNKLALAYAKHFGLYTICASDVHTDPSTRQLGYTAFDTPINNVLDLVNKVKNKESNYLGYEPFDDNETCNHLSISLIHKGSKTIDDKTLKKWCDEAGYIFK